MDSLAQSLSSRDVGTSKIKGSNTTITKNQILRLTNEYKAAQQDLISYISIQVRYNIKISHK